MIRFVVVMLHMRMVPTILLLAPLSLASCATTEDMTGYYPETCEVHHATLKRDVVPILYGLIIVDARYREASKSFPHANREILGGCISTPDSASRAEVLYCPDCRDVESAFATAVK